MKFFYYRILIFACLLSATSSVKGQVVWGNCDPSFHYEYLDINNVKALISANGIFFRSGYDSFYEVPKDSQKHSYYQKSLWFGGKDQYGILRVAAMNYGQVGYDFFPGPLTVDGHAQIDPETSYGFSKPIKISRAEVDLFRKWFEVYSINPVDAATQFPGYSIPESIINWPAHGDTSKGYSFYIAPFVDKNGDGIYNPFDGDYPAYDFGELQLANGKLWGHQTIWQLINDKGNLHSESGGLPLGIEIQHQSFAFVSNDALNDATFYHMQIINRSVNTYSDFNISFFNHFMLGYEYDNYFGFDVSRGLFYCFNGDSIDGSGHYSHYGANPPATGIKLFRGPLKDPDGIDNQKYDIFIDPVTGDTSYVQRCDESINGQNFGNGIADDERLGFTRFISYGFPASFWADNPTSPAAFYNYQQSIWRDGTKLNYGGLGHPYAGSYGPDCNFMFPGDSDPCNWGTGGVMPNGPQDWATYYMHSPGMARGLATTGSVTFHPGDTIDLIYGILWARAISNDPFESLELLKTISDEVENYFEDDFAGLCDYPILDFHYNISELQADFYYFDDAISYFWDFGDGYTSTDKNPVHYYDQPGIYNVCIDIHSSCDTSTICREINVKYLRNKLSVLITRIEGHGNGGLELELTQTSKDDIMSGPPWRSDTLEYYYNRGPVDIFIPDTTNYTIGDFVIKFTGVEDTSRWVMYMAGGVDTIYSQYAIGEGKYEYIPIWGLMVGVKQVNEPNCLEPDCGYIYSNIVFHNNAPPWLTGVKDCDVKSTSEYNWIRSGIYNNLNFNLGNDYFEGNVPLDPNEIFENVIGGTWSPYRLASRTQCAPAWSNIISQNLNKLEYLHSVDIVLTPDKSKWSRCPVIETGFDKILSVDNVEKHHIRKAPSVDNNGNPDGTGTGMGWFPGYAINVETGERLNVMFGESSWMAGENGNDMIFNPTHRLETNIGDILWGGKHFLYVFANRSNLPDHDLSPAYDQGTWARSKLMAGDNTSMRRLYQSIMWTSIPLAIENTNWLSSEVTIRIRVSRPYKKGYSDIPGNIAPFPQNNNNPMYAFSTNNVNLNIDLIQNNKTLKVLISPNPFSETTVMTFSKEADEIFDLYIIDVNGSVMSFYSGINEGQIVIHKNDMPQGIYIYRLVSTKGRYASGKIVIM